MLRTKSVRDLELGLRWTPDFPWTLELTVRLPRPFPLKMMQLNNA